MPSGGHRRCEQVSDAVFVSTTRSGPCSPNVASLSKVLAGLSPVFPVVRGMSSRKLRTAVARFASLAAPRCSTSAADRARIGLSAEHTSASECASRVCSPR